MFFLENLVLRMSNIHNNDVKKLSIVDDVVKNLPLKEEAVPKNFSNVPVVIIREHIENNLLNSETINSSPEGAHLFDRILDKLDELKNKLGGHPNFTSKPTINMEDNTRTFFGIPMAGVKDWLRMTLVKEWRPKIFWESLAKIFSVTLNQQYSQYEEAYLSIQRFALLIANKERFFDILDFMQEERYGELSTITGLAWHPHANSINIEKIYIEFVEKFLTEYFEAAQQKGDEALLEYFKAFSGVCFEDRARSLEAYAIEHPLMSIANDLPIAIPPDWDTNQPAENAFMKETQALYEQIKKAPTTDQLLKHLEDKGIFELEFVTATGTKKVKPSKEQFHSWAKKQVEAYILSE